MPWIAAQQRLDELTSTLLAFAALDFGARARVSERGNNFDAVAAGLNMLGEELGANTVARSYLESVLASMGDALLVLTAEGHVRTANASACQMWGTSEAALIGRPVRELFQDEHDGPSRALQDESSRELPMRLVPKEGMPIEVNVNVEPMRDASGQRVGTVLVARDVRELRALVDQLETSLDALRATQTKLIDASRRAGMAEVATGVLHNVGNVLNSLSTSASIAYERVRGSRVPLLRKAVDLIHTPTDARERDALSYLSKLADYLDEDRTAMLAEMTDLSRHIDDVKMIVSRQQDYAASTPVLEPAAVSDLVEDALRNSASAVAASGAVVVREIADIPLLLLDRGRALDVLTNYLSNAAQSLAAAPRADKRIVIRACRNVAGKLAIDVVDNGLGIPPEHQKKLFTYGFTTRAGGHGFGLASSVLAARAMGGSATARSDGPGTGATFTLELPYRLADETIAEKPTL